MRRRRQSREAEEKKYRSKVEDWLEENQGRFGVWWDQVLFVWYSRRPTSVRWLSWPYRAFVAALAASGPAIAYQTSNVLTFQQAVAGGFGLLVVHVALKSADVWSAKRSSKTDLVAEEMWIRVGDLLNSVKSDATPMRDRDGSIEATLAIMSGYARLVTKDSSADISATLVCYRGTGQSQMTVTHRQRGSSRPTNRHIKDIEYVLGHHACQAGYEPRIVPNLRRFGPRAKKSLTMAKANYRSMLILPVRSRSSQEIKGFISIDSSRPFAFNGNRAGALMVAFEPYQAHIEDLI